MFDFTDIRMLAMHRVKSAEMLEDPANLPNGFDLDDYISSGAFGFGGKETISLEAVFTNPSGNHLYETRLSTDQVITPLDHDRLKVTATVVNTEQLRWWLLGFGERVEVLAPLELRESIAQTATALANLYHAD
jgi:predicted DNA-binding transcriptional regulator YafY